MLNEEKKISEEQITMSREVFEKITQLIDTVCSQQGTIADQQRAIDRLTTLVESKADARLAEGARCADVG